MIGRLAAPHLAGQSIALLAGSLLLCNCEQRREKHYLAFSSGTFALTSTFNLWQTPAKS
jgi:hypothetical protein